MSSVLLKGAIMLKFAILNDISMKNKAKKTPDTVLDTELSAQKAIVTLGLFQPTKNPEGTHMDSERLAEHNQAAAAEYGSRNRDYISLIPKPRILRETYKSS